MPGSVSIMIAFYTPCECARLVICLTIIREEPRSRERPNKLKLKLKNKPQKLQEIMLAAKSTCPVNPSHLSQSKRLTKISSKRIALVKILMKNLNNNEQI